MNAKVKSIHKKYKINIPWKTSKKQFKSLSKLAIKSQQLSNKKVLKIITGRKISSKLSFIWLIALALLTNLTISREIIVVQVKMSCRNIHNYRSFQFLLKKESRYFDKFQSDPSIKLSNKDIKTNVITNITED